MRHGGPDESMVEPTLMPLPLSLLLFFFFFLASRVRHQYSSWDQMLIAHPWKEFVWNEWIHRLHKLLKFIVMQFQFNYFQWLICWILCSNFVTYFDQSLRSQKMGIVVFYETILCRSNFQFLFLSRQNLFHVWCGLA